MWRDIYGVDEKKVAVMVREDKIDILVELTAANNKLGMMACKPAPIQVARDAVLRFRPQINITPYHANVKDPDFDVDFFMQFNVVLNGLDNLDTMRHVNRLCLVADVPLVETGTTGFLGQAVHDGVDILNLSVGPNSPPATTRTTYLNPFDATLLSAVKAGIFD